MIPMSRDLVKVGFRHQRGLCQKPAAALFLVLDKALKQLDHPRPVRKHDGKPLSDNVNGRKYPEFPAEFVVIALFRLFEFREMLFEFRSLRERHAVNALQHLVFRVAAPICARAGRQFYRLDLFQVVKMRSRAKIDKFTLTVKTYRFAVGQIVYKFLLIRLVCLEFQRLILRKSESLENKALFDDLSHLVLDRREHFGRERDGSVEIVIKTVVDRGSYREFDRRIKSLDRLRENVGRRVPERLFSLFVRKRVKRQRVSVLRFCAQIAYFAAYPAAESVARKSRRYLHRAVISGSTFRDFERRTVFEEYFHLDYLFFRI